MNDTAGLPPSLFQACVAMVAIDNRIYKQTNVRAPDGRPLSPLEIYDHRVRSSSKELFAPLRVYGCLCFSLQHSNKQITKAERCVMLGPAPDNPKAYLLMSLERRRYFISRDIIAEETSFPFKKAFAICPIVHEPSRDDTDDDDGVPKTVEDIQPLNTTQVDNFLVHEEAVAPDDEVKPEQVQAPSLVATPAATTLDDAPSVSASLSDLFSMIDTTKSDPPVTRAQVASTGNAERTKLGTGDKAPDARRSPAKFEVGRLYESSFYGEPVRIVKNNDDGDVQVTFPENTDTRQYTIDKSEIDEIEFDGQALILEQRPLFPAYDLQELNNPLDWIPIAYNGLLVPSCSFSLLDDDHFQRHSTSTPSKLSQQHGGLTADSKYHVALLTSADLVGKVLAEDLDIPKYHFSIKDHPLKPLCHQSMRKEMDTLTGRSVFGQGRPSFDGEAVIGTMFVLKAKSDADGLLSKIKARLTVLGNQEKQDLLSYSPVMLLTSMRLLLSLHTADLKVSFHALDITAAFVSARAVRDITVRLPKGFEPKGHQPAWVYPLLFNLYGTIDAPRAFYLDYFQWHRDIGFKSIHEDQCYLTIQDGDEFIKFVTHVDDSIIRLHGGATVIRFWACASSATPRLAPSPSTKTLRSRR